MIQLMGEKDLYDYWSDTYKVHSLDWSKEKAASILSEWQSKFGAEVRRVVEKERLDRRYEVNAFSSSQLDALMEEFSEFRVQEMVMGLGLMVSKLCKLCKSKLLQSLQICIFSQLLYAAVTLSRWNDVVRSQSAIGIAGVLIAALGVPSGLGLCALLGVTFNAATSQIVPFLALGLGVDSMFLLAQTYGELVSNPAISEEVSPYQQFFPPPPTVFLSFDWQNHIAAAADIGFSHAILTAAAAHLPGRKKPLLSV